MVRNRFAVLHFHQCPSVATPDFPKGVTGCEHSGQPIAIGRHRLRADRVQCHQDVVAPRPKAADPVLRPTRSGIAHQFCASGRSGNERAERFERKRGNTILDFQGNETRPGDPEVEAIVGLAAREIGQIVSRPRLEPDMPVLGGGDLRRVGLVAADEPSEKISRLGGDTDRQQEMPHHRHSITPENEALDIVELQCNGLRDFVAASSKQTVQQALVFLAHRGIPASLSATRA